ncbi:BatA domain-containing protein [Candidatus Sumerlaeota bacterium]|nr:BatA domain-containing protein [Candidatus Sumerlaeota bacterium]
MNLIFLNPYLLLGTLAAAIPVVLHLLSRQRSKRIPFTALFLLRRVDVQTARRHKLVDILLLLLRTLLFLLIALALAKPMLRPRDVRGLATGNLLRIILIDDSLSSRLVYKGKSIYDRERSMAESALKNLPSGDAALLLTTSGTQTPESASPGRNASEILESLKNSKPSCSSRSSITSLNQLLQGLSESEKRGFEIVVITDRQKFSFEGSLETGLLLKRQARIYLCPVEIPEETDNLTLTQTNIQSALPFPGFPVYMEYQILNHSPNPQDAIIRLWNDSQILEQKKQTVSGNASFTGNFTFTPRDIQNRTGRIEMESDALPEDNRFFFNLPLLEKAKILVVSAPNLESMEKDGSLFISIALEPFDKKEKDASFYQMEHASIDNIEKTDLDDFSLLFFLNIPEWKESIATHIEKYIKTGGAAVFFHGTPLFYLNSSKSPANLKSIVPFRLEYARSKINKEQPEMIGDCDPDHPIIKSLKKIPRLDFSSIHFYQLLNIRIPPEGAAFHTIMKTKKGSSLLIEKNIGKGKVLHLLSGLDPESGDLATKPFFIPFLFDTMKYLLKSDTGKYGICGDSITLEYDDSQREKIPREITTPEGDKIDLSWEQNALRFTKTQIPGNYVYKPQKGDTVPERYFSINVDPREGDLTRVSIQEIAKLFPETIPVTLCQSPLELEKSLARNRSGTSLSFPLFLAAFIAFLLEILFANLLLFKRKTTNDL